jgi:2',3'-cyclic-nucleotide 2'-phosphodiesterase (5'-nucleotidase family)
MRRIVKASLVILILLSVSCVGGPAQDSGDVRPLRFHLTVLHTNDFHGEDYAALARTCGVIRKIESEEKNALYLDAGDTFTRGPYQNVFFGELEFAVLNAIGCRALTLGNNEFKADDFAEAAQRHLSDRIKQAEFPVLCANVRRAADGACLPGVKPSVVLTMAGVRIGVVGVSASRIRDYNQIKGFIVDDPIETAKALAPELASRSDIVLALTHIGFDDDVRLAAAGTRIQAIIGGDSHTTLRKPFVVKDTPIVQAGEYGHFLGRLDLYFTLQNGVYRLDNYKGVLIPIDDSLPEDAEIKALIDSFLKKAEKEAA